MLKEVSCEWVREGIGLVILLRAHSLLDQRGN